MSTGRTKSLLASFPDARIVYLVRNPYNVIPSFISMFSAAWKAHSKELAGDSDEARAWGHLGMDYYNYFRECIPLIPKENFINLDYQDLVKQPFATINKIYDQFGIDKDPEFIARLKAATEVSRSYKSKHNYSLAQYGLSREIVEEELKEMIDEYGFS